MSATPGRLELLVPARGSFAGGLLLAVHLTAFGGFLVWALLNALGGEPRGNWRIDPAHGILILAGIIGMLAFQFNNELLGRERLSIDQTSLVIRREILGFDRRWTWDLRRVRGVRAADRSAGASSRWSGLRFWSLSEGCLEFDDEKRTIRFGLGLESDEVAAILEAIQDCLRRQ